ncbi:MAG: Beta-ketoacyl synthase [Paucimonas sp.]|nr:Beta-ketoacyl synthase [Paucimonas sp.]
MSEHDLQTWLRDHLAAELKLQASQLPVDEPFEAIGVDSLLAVTLLEEIRKGFGLRMKPTAIYENNSIQALAAHIHVALATV